VDGFSRGRRTIYEPCGVQPAGAHTTLREKKLMCSIIDLSEIEEHNVNCYCGDLVWEYCEGGSQRVWCVAE